MASRLIVVTHESYIVKKIILQINCIPIYIFIIIIYIDILIYINILYK